MKFKSYTWNKVHATLIAILRNFDLFYGQQSFFFLKAKRRTNATYKINKNEKKIVIVCLLFNTIFCPSIYIFHIHHIKNHFSPFFHRFKYIQFLFFVLAICFLFICFYLFIDFFKFSDFLFGSYFCLQIGENVHNMFTRIC